MQQTNKTIFFKKNNLINKNIQFKKQTKQKAIDVTNKAAHPA